MQAGQFFRGEVLMKLRYAVVSAVLALTSPAFAEEQERISPLPTDPPASTGNPATPAPAVSVFDPARHMRVAEVRPGMTGYGLSVFSGTRIERFEVEVLSVLKNFNPKYD